MKVYLVGGSRVAELTVIEGDGIGPEITSQTIRVLEHLKAPFTYRYHPAGLQSFERTGELIPEETLNSIKATKLAIKGPTTTPVGGGHRSINVSLRQSLDLYANVRPVRSLPGIKSPYKDLDFVIIRENTEGMYTGEEKWEDPDTAISIKRITRSCSERISRFAFQYAQQNKRCLVSVAHKANIMKLADGLFLECFGKAAKDYPDIKTSDYIIDNCCMQMVRRPEQFDVLVTANLYGDILSDLGAGLVGGLGVAPGANIGTDIAIFEAVHGSAPDIAGQGKANPTALMLSAVMLLHHVNEHQLGERLLKALKTCLASGQQLTADLGGQASTEAFTDELIAHLK